jgi:hypothetical protein
MITQIPDYNEPARPESSDVKQAAPATHVETAAPGFLGGPEVPGPSTLQPAAPATLPAATHAFGAADPFARPAPQAQTITTPKVDPTRPKPPVSVRRAQVLPSRKHRARSR